MYERPTAPSVFTSSIRMRYSCPIRACNLSALICACTAIKRCNLSSITSSGTWSGKSLALAPLTGEYLKQPTRSSCAASKKSSNSSNSASVSPGKPTIKVERITNSGQISRHLAMRSNTLSELPGRFISLSMRLLAC